MKKIIILIAFLLSMLPAKPGIGTKLREAVYNVNLQASPDGQLSQFDPSIVKSLTNQETGFSHPQKKYKQGIVPLQKKLSQSYTYFPEFCYTDPKCHEIQIDLGSAVTAITELHDGRLVLGSEQGVVKVVSSPGNIDRCIQFNCAIEGIIELHSQHYSGYIAVLLSYGIALINPNNFNHNIFEIHEGFLDDFDLIGFQELHNGPLKGMILIIVEEGLVIFNTFKKEFFPKIDHYMLNNFIENTFFESPRGDLYFITEDFNLIKCSLTVDSENINIAIKEEPNPHVNQFTNVYKYLYIKKGVIAFSRSQNDDVFLRGIGLHRNNVLVDYRGNCPATLRQTQGTIESIIPLKNNSQCACLLSVLGSLRFLKLFSSSIIQEFDFLDQGGATVITSLKEGNIAIGLGNGNISICTLYDPNLKNLSIRQVALLVNLIKSYNEAFANYRANLDPFVPAAMFELSPTVDLHPEWFDIFTTLPEIYQEPFKNMVAVDPLSDWTSLLIKNSHPNPGEESPDNKRANN